MQVEVFGISLKPVSSKHYKRVSESAADPAKDWVCEETMTMMMQLTTTAWSQAQLELKILGEKWNVLYTTWIATRCEAP